MKSVVFGGKQHERLEIVVHGYERAVTGDFYDDNWLNVGILIDCGAFHGKIQASFLTGEFESFRTQATSLYETLKGKAEFRTLEEQLSFDLTCDNLGHIQIRGKALDQSGIGNCLRFTIQIDQTQLQSSLQSLGEILAAYPVRT